MAEQLSNLGYLAIKKESTKGTPLTPTIYLPFFSDTLNLDANKNDIAPVIGIKNARYTTILGQRSIKGNIMFLGEPNAAGYLFDMLLKKGSTVDANPLYTHPFTLDGTTMPNSYTVDIARGQVVFRYMGVEASEIGVEFDNNVMRLNTAVTARGVLSMRRITNNATGVLTLASEYSDTPTKGFVADDLIRIFKAGGTTIDTTVTTVTEADDTITVASSTGVANGDYVCLRKATPSLSLTGNYFTWGKTQFRFGADASAALSATHTPVDEGTVKIMHNMLPDTGAHRSGALDIASIVRGVGDVEVSTKIFFDTGQDEERFLANSKRACVVRCFAGSSNEHELRLTLNQLSIASAPKNINVNDIIFDQIAWKPEYHVSDAQAFDVKVINGVATI